MEGSAAGNILHSDDESDLKKFLKTPKRTEDYDMVVKEYKDTILPTDGGVEECQASIVTDSVGSTDLKLHLSSSKA